MNHRHPGAAPQPDGWRPRLYPWIFLLPAEDEIFSGLGELCPRQPKRRW